MNLTGTIINNKFRVIEKISSGNMGEVYLGEIIKTGNKVAAKILNNTLGQVENIIRFQTESSIISQINHPNIVKIYESGCILSEIMPAKYYIVMEYIEGQNLRDILLLKKVLSVSDSIDIIIQTCSALEFIHDKGVIHRDLKPSNILIGKDKTVNIIDFGLSQMRELNQFNSLDEIVGTFSYLAPVKNGKHEGYYPESIDLYSLGIVFYQMLTGELPFTGDAIISIMHQHLAKVPDPPSNFNSMIPGVIEKIILKMIEKDPEKRYQSARGVIYDLNCFKRGRKNYILGLADKSVKINFKSNMVGRKNESNYLTKLYDQALEGNGNLCLISGESGVGKSRLVEELKENIDTNNISFVMGKSIAGDNKTPYGPLHDAIYMYMKRFNHYTTDKKKGIKTKVQLNSKKRTDILLKFNPLIKEIIGESSCSSGIKSVNENVLFRTLLSQFLLNLSRAEDGITVFLEDIQWLDSGSFELLTELMKEISGYPLFIIATYRSNEIQNNCRLREFIDSSYNLDRALNAIQLDTLRKHETEQFISELLIDDTSIISQITEIIHQKSNGNPFFSLEILKQLVDEKALYYENSKWNIDYGILCQIKISKSIIDVILDRVSQLNVEEKIILSYAAVIGKTFDVKFLYELDDRINIFGTLKYKDKFLSSKIDIDRSINKALSLNLLEENYLNNRCISFTHDRIREAFYLNINKSEKKILHLQIASILEEINNDDENTVFEIANHYIQSDNKTKVLEYSFKAGLKSKGKYANDTAIHYFTIALEILEDTKIFSTDNYKAIWLKSKESMGEIFLTIGKYDEAIKLFSEMLPYSKKAFEKSLLYKQICNAYLKKGDWSHTEIYGKKGLELLGENLPLDNFEIYIAVTKEFMKYFLFKIVPGRLKNIQFRNIEKLKLIIQLYLILGWSYGLSNTHKFCYTGLRSYNLMNNRIRESREGAICMGGAGMFLQIIPLFKKAEKYHSRRLEISKLLGDEWGIAQSNQWMGFCRQWAGDYSGSMDYFRKSIMVFHNFEEIREITISNLGLFENYYYISDYENLEKTNNEYYDAIKESGDNYGISSSQHYKTLLYLEKGDLDKCEKLAFKNYNFSFVEKIWYRYYLAAVLLGRLFLEKNDIDKSLEFFSEAEHLRKNRHFIGHYTAQHDIYMAEAKIRKCSASYSECLKFKLDIKNAGKYTLKAFFRARNWATHKGTSYRILAMYYDLKDKNKAAGKMFLKSIHWCKKINRKYELGKCYYEYGLFLKKSGELNRAIGSFESAYIIFINIGSNFYKEKIADMLNIQQTEKDRENSLIKQQKTDFLINIQKEIVEFQNTDKLLEYLLFRTLILTGAQRGYIFIHNDSENILELKASKNIIEGETSFYSKKIIDKVFQDGEIIVTTDAETEKKFHKFNSIASNNLKSIICMPLKLNKKIIGVYYMDNPLIRGVFNDYDIDFLKSFLPQIITVIHSKYQNIFSKKKSGEKGKIELTEVTKKKLDKIINYISLNYTSNISREALAYSEEMSPNYMSKLFKEYTGKRINEYINDLRIREAETKLRETDQNIIDIAYSVGFESLRTFNRFFLLSNSVTPTDYRKNQTKMMTLLF